MPRDRTVAGQAGNVPREALARRCAAAAGRTRSRGSRWPAFRADCWPARETHGASTGQHFDRRLELCRELGVQTLVVAGDMVGPLDAAGSRPRASRRWRRPRERPATHGLRLALEFQGRATFANNLQTAAALVAEVGSPHLGLCLDVFHYYIGPEQARRPGLSFARELVSRAVLAIWPT